MRNNELYEKYLMKTYGFNSITLVKGDGSYLYDENNKKYLDFTSGIGVNSLGYGDKDQLEAIKSQVDKLLHTSNLFLNDITPKVGEKLINLTSMSRVFFSNSGTESIEGAIKIARKYSFDKYGVGRGKILTLKGSFHGRTLVALSATGQDKFHKYFHPFPEGFDYVEKNNIDDLKAKMDSSTCAIIMEPILGEGGVIPLNKSFVEEVVNICKENDVLVIFDEVQTGIGRTGYFLAQEYFGVSGDITTLAKGLGGGVPVGAILCSHEVSDVLSIGDHGSTYGGNPLVMSSANVVLDKVGKKEFLDSVKIKGEILVNEIKKINSSCVNNIKGRGLMVGVDINKDVKEVLISLREKGLLALSAGANTLRILPPLTITEEEIKLGVKIIREVLES